jgi:NAD(P)-dependent dehydrogenase (short-subunit alcohol dehydrogenase family)
MGTAVITGGAGGIGKAIAMRLALEGYGVIIFDVDGHAGKKLARDLKSVGNGDFILVDVGSERSVRNGMEKVRKKYESIDVLVNNAGIVDIHMGSINGIDLRKWHRIMDVNLTSVIHMAKYSYPLFTNGKGSIVNIASTRFLQSEPNTFAYSASKGGMVSLTHSLAVSLGPGIRVNCISPGWIDTGNTDLRPEDHGQHPCGRVGVPEDVAALVSFLISADSGFITGQNYITDGGMTKKMIYAE